MIVNIPFNSKYIRLFMVVNIQKYSWLLTIISTSFIGSNFLSTCQNLSILTQQLSH